MKIKVKGKKDPLNVLSVSEVSQAAVRFCEAVNSLSGRLINKSSEIEALKLCILTGNNLMLEGPHGVAKSMLAELFFDSVTGACVYSKQFMKGTQTDEIFGPLNSKKYKEEAIWEHNMDGMLPQADFAFLDEVYRASDMALPSMMSILNEKTFRNGSALVRCPLVTAIGTTNFTSESEQLEAFHDRWLFKVLVKPLSNISHRRKMLKVFLDGISEIDAQKTVSLADIKLLQRAARVVPINEQIIELYENTVSLYKKKLTEKPYISDRRLCLALRVAQASFVLADPEAAVRKQEMSPDHLSATAYGITTLNNEDQNRAFAEALEEVVGDYRNYIKENETITVFTKAVRAWTERFDPGMSKKSAEKLYTTVRKTLAGLQCAPPEEKPQSQANIEKMREIEQDLAGLLASLAPIIEKK